MPHIQRSFTHTLDANPTTLAYNTSYYINYRTGTGTFLNATHSSSQTVVELSKFFYQDLHALINSVNDFPFEVDFLEDEDVQYISGQIAPGFKIGTMSYIPRIVTYNNQYLPMFDTLYDDASSSYVSNRLRGESTSNTYFRNLCNIQGDASVRSYDYTLHVYYNTDYVYIGFTTARQSIITGLLTQVCLTDRIGVDWYLITGSLGLDYFGNDYFSSSNYQLRRVDSTETGLDTQDIIGFRYNVGTYLLNSGYTYAPSTTTEFPKTVSRNDTTNIVRIIGNPASMKLSTLNYGNFTLSEFNQELAANDKVIVARPVFFGGILDVPNHQVLVASENIATNVEHTINNTTYFCPGDPQLTNMIMPFLFEI